MPNYDMRVVVGDEHYHAIGSFEDISDLPDQVRKSMAFELQKRIDPNARRAAASAESQAKYDEAIRIMEHANGKMAYGQKVALAAALGASPPPKPGEPEIDNAKKK